ncbi:hypothetical protein SDC9_198492 [bioreactor metagenome]|uniref:DNA topoisomerase type IA zn finger domain-containing protein n=1 Tax=bioreactor metagenome TaxID=1076179 RepID=A0A645IJ34_9ZZZZ
MRPLLGIELDDKSHDKADRQARDQLVEGVFKAAGLPLVRFAVKSGYSPGDIQSQIMAHFEHEGSAVNSQGPEAPTGAPRDSAPACPKCGSKMILRTAKSGANAGGQFWGCSNFPRCRSVLEFGHSPMKS